MNLDALKQSLEEAEWRRTLIALYDDGASDREVMRELDLTPAKWDALYGDLEYDFREMVDLGRAFSHAWWETQGRKNLNNKSFNTPLWTINMKNRFGWSEKTETSMTNIDMGNKDDQELMRLIQQRIEQLEKSRGKTSV